MNVIVLYSDPIVIPRQFLSITRWRETRLKILIEYILGRNTIRNTLLNWLH